MILADTGVLFGGTDGDDPRHADCAAVLDAYVGELAVVVPIIVECAWLIESRLGPACDIFSLTPSTNQSSIFASLPTTETTQINQIAFDPTGNYLLLANGGPTYRLTILDRSGNIVNDVPLASEPFGVAVIATNPSEVVTNNADGSLTSLSFANNAYNTAPVITQLANGGYAGLGEGVGPDGCVYVTQGGTNFADGTTSTASSIVRICAGGGSGPTNPMLSLATTNATYPGTGTVTATLLDGTGAPIVGTPIPFAIVSGANAQALVTLDCVVAGGATIPMGAG